MTRYKEPMNALITGSSRGIGRAIAIRLAKHGGKIVINYFMNEEAAQETAEAVKKAGGQPVIVQANVRDPKDCKRLAATLDSYDVLVHNAAMGVLKPAEKIRTNQWDLTLESSARPFWLLSMDCLDRLNPGSSIIGISSLGSVGHVPGYAAVGASKAVMEALTRQLAVELAPRQIRVNTVRGGLVDTDALNYFQDKEQMLAVAKKITPFKRVGTADDIAGAVEILIDPRAAWITGQILVADGGLSLV
jgi:enoyl-[acyl-carrier protein] reductase III